MAAIIGPRGPAGILFTQPIGDGAATVFTIDHELHTRNLLVNIYRRDGSGPDIIADVYRPTDDQIRIEFLEAPGATEYQVVIVGVAS